MWGFTYHMFGCPINCVRIHIFFRIFIIIESAVKHNRMEKGSFCLKNGPFVIPFRRRNSDLQCSYYIYIYIHVFTENMDNNDFLVIYTSFFSNWFFFSYVYQGTEFRGFVFRHLFRLFYYGQSKRILAIVTSCSHL